MYRDFRIVISFLHSLADAYTLSMQGNMLQKHGFISELEMNELKRATWFYKKKQPMIRLLEEWIYYLFEDE